MNWISLIRDLLPAIIKVAEVIHGRKNSKVKRAAALRSTLAALSAEPTAEAEGLIGAEIDRVVAHMNATGELSGEQV